MNNTPSSNRTHIGIYGSTNVGKSSFINKVFNKDISIVSEIGGTTTDPIYKNMELDNVGSIRFLDTAGFLDSSDLGELRYKKTIDTLDKIDIAIYIFDVLNFRLDDYNEFLIKIKNKNIEVINVINKIDLIDDKELKGLKTYIGSAIEDPIYISSLDGSNIDLVLSRLKELIKKTENKGILDDLLLDGSDILMILSIDSEYPQGRIILPQSQMIRDGLSNKHFITIIEEENLVKYIEKGNNIDLAIADSKIFNNVSSILDESILLTSFSILFAHNKGDLNMYLDGIKYMEANKHSDVKILIYESCNHTANHEDIGRVKIPNLLTNFFTGNISMDFSNAGNIMEFLDYDLIIHCGACMETRKTMDNKLKLAKDNNIQMVNYGILLAYFANILDRSVELFL